MINHIRTLLLNRAADNTATNSGEEFVPIDFVPQTLTGVISRVHGLLFGASTDRTLLNYKLRLLMPCLHATELVSYVTDKDSRVTYWPETDFPYLSTIYVPTELNVAGNCTIQILNTLTAPVASDTLQYTWRFTVNASTIDIELLQPADGTTTYDYTITNQRSNLLSLPGTEHLFTFNGSDGDITLYSQVARPELAFADIYNTICRYVNYRDLEQLFSTPGAEPYKTFSNLWQQRVDPYYKVGGLLLALGYALDEQLNG